MQRNSSTEPHWNPSDSFEEIEMTTFGATDSYIPDEDELDVTYPTDEFEEIEITEFRMGLEDRVDLDVIGMQDNPV